MSVVIEAEIGGNSRVFFVKGSMTAIVDTGAPGNGRAILKALKIAGIPREQVSLIIITHAHIDHYGSARELKAALGVPAMAGWPDAGYMERGENAPVRASPAAARGQDALAIKADIVVTEDASLQSYGIDARALMTPGHTDGSLSVLASNGDCATGDFLASLHTGPPDVIWNGLRKAAAGGAKWFCPSHAPRADVAAVISQFSGQ